jgi:transposase-like protein
MAKRGRKPTHDLSGLNCPNPECPAFGKSGQTIVANGAYTTRYGEGRRFKCQACGRSFCSRTGTIFHDLRTPETKVLAALKLLLKGMTLRRVAETLETKPDTVRSWLTLADNQFDEVCRLLLQEPGVTQAEIDALRTCVQNNALRRRAIAWRQRCGWRQSWA